MLWYVLSRCHPVHSPVPGSARAQEGKSSTHLISRKAHAMAQQTQQIATLRGIERAGKPRIRRFGPPAEICECRNSTFSSPLANPICPSV